MKYVCGVCKVVKRDLEKEQQKEKERQTEKKQQRRREKQEGGESSRHIKTPPETTRNSSFPPCPHTHTHTQTHTHTHPLDPDSQWNIWLHQRRVVIIVYGRESYIHRQRKKKNKQTVRQRHRQRERQTGENWEGEREKRDGLQKQQLIAGVGAHLVRVIHCQNTEGKDRENGARRREKNKNKTEDRDDRTG